MSLKSNGFLAHEVEIVWLEDVSGLAYIREAYPLAFSRQKPIAHSLGNNRAGQVGLPGTTRTVGYAKLAPGSPSLPEHPGFFCRRVFWIDADDTSHTGQVPGENIPSGAVDPKTIQPGQWGTLIRPAQKPSLRTPTTESQASEPIAEPIAEPIDIAPGSPAPTPEKAPDQKADVREAQRLLQEALELITRASAYPMGHPQRTALMKQGDEKSAQARTLIDQELSP